MTDKPILTKEQFYAKCNEFNNIPTEDRLAGMRMSLDCEYARELLNHAWDFAKKTATEAGKTNLDNIYWSFDVSVIKTILESAGAPSPAIEVLADKLSKCAIMHGMIWHVFTEVAPEEDVVLLTGNFDVYSEVSNG